MGARSDARPRGGGAGDPQAIDARIVGVDALPDPTRLEPLARRIFGEGDRPPGWFTRKLRREVVDPTLSALAIRQGARPDDPNGWLGYVLVGTPASLGEAARTSGTGVVPAARGHGLATRLLDAAARRCARAGLRRLQLLAEAALEPFYRARGFDLLRRTVTVLSFGEASPAPDLRPPLPWRSLEPDEGEPVAWLAEAWAGTPHAARHGLTWAEGHARVTAWLSREGTAWLGQRLVTRGSIPLLVAAHGLRQRMPRGQPVLLPLLSADAAPTHALLDAGWAEAQRGALLERPLPSTRFTAAAPGSHDARKPPARDERD